MCDGDGVCIGYICVISSVVIQLMLFSHISPVSLYTSGNPDNPDNPSNPDSPDSPSSSPDNPDNPDNHDRYGSDCISLGVHHIPV